MNSLKEKLLTLPTTSGVYLMKDRQGNIIYVGKAKNLKRRVNSYFIKNEKNLKTQLLVENIADFDYILASSELDALMLENNLIKKYMPHFNILLKDGKNFAYIKINLNEEYPKFFVTRKVKNDGCKYFGPFFAGVSYLQILEIIQVAFLVRNCNKKFSSKKPLSRPCLNFMLGLCTAPCVNKVSKQEYRQQVDYAVDFLNGNTKQVEEILKQKMELASQNLNFERAIKIREQLKALDRLKVHFTAQFPKCKNLDCLNYYSNGLNLAVSVLNIRNGKMIACDNFNLTGKGDFKNLVSQFLSQYYKSNRIIPAEIVVPFDFDDKELMEQWLTGLAGKNVKLRLITKGVKKQLLELAKQNAKEFLEKSLGVEKIKNSRTIGACERLKEVLNLKSVPYRMECYDISNISGTNKVASMVVFVNGEPAKKMYRKFIIKTVEGQDDFASLKEALFRRMQELKIQKDVSFSAKPNLIVIDGGKGQLSSVYEILTNFGKTDLDFDLISLAKQNEEVFLPNNPISIVLKKSDVALQLLQRIRDEAHRFAITFHRQRRAKDMIKSELDNVKGLPKTKKKELLNYFGSIEKIKTASEQNLQMVNGIGTGLSKKIYDYFHKK